MYHKKQSHKEQVEKSDLDDPFTGIAKPEPLKGNLTGFRSRRMDREHRLVYSMQENTLYIVACRFHY